MVAHAHEVAQMPLKPFFAVKNPAATDFEYFQHCIEACRHGVSTFVAAPSATCDGYLLHSQGFRVEISPRSGNSRARIIYERRRFSQPDVNDRILGRRRARESGDTTPLLLDKRLEGSDRRADCG